MVKNSKKILKNFEKNISCKFKLNYKVFYGKNLKAELSLLSEKYGTDKGYTKSEFSKLYTW